MWPNAEREVHMTVILTTQGGRGDAVSSQQKRIACRKQIGARIRSIYMIENDLADCVGV